MGDDPNQPYTVDITFRVHIPGARSVDDAIEQARQYLGVSADDSPNGYATDVMIRRDDIPRDE